MSVKRYMAATVESCPDCDGEGFCDGPGDGHPSTKSECISCEGTGRTEVVPGMVDAVAQLEAENAELKKDINRLSNSVAYWEQQTRDAVDRAEELQKQNADLLERVRELEAAFEGEPAAYLHVMPADEGGEDWSIVSTDDDPVEVFGSKYFEFCAKNGRHPEIHYLYKEPTNEG